MPTPTRTSWAARLSAIFIALAPLTALAQQNPAMPRPLAEFLASLPRALQLSPATAKALNESNAAIREQRYAEARAALAELNLDTLAPYERSNTEHLLFKIAYAEKRYGEARQHILNALASGGLNEQEVGHARDRLAEVDAALAQAPPT